MQKSLYVLDARDVWHGPMIAAARARGWSARRVHRGSEVPAGPHDGARFGFIRTHADPAELHANRDDDLAMRAAGLVMIQDRGQVEVYEDKSEQFRRWGGFMPETWRVTSRAELAGLMASGQVRGFPLVSKADQGASSVNVRILENRAALEAHAEKVFGGGIRVKCCAGSAAVMQRDYLLLQRFVPHDVTWRVNIVGRQLAIFRRFNYPDRPVAQTGNTVPVKALDEQTEGLLRWSMGVFAALGTRWCAIDALWDGDAAGEVGQWRLLETSLAWPWPSPGDCNNGIFFIPDAGAPGGFRAGRRWIEMMDVMLDEAERGAWTA